MQNAFAITPDPALFYPSDSHRLSFGALQKGLGETGGFLILTGEAGTGKTLLKRKLLAEVLSPDDCIGEVVATAFTDQEQMSALMAAFGLSGRDFGLAEKQDCLAAYLGGMQQNGHKCLLVIDDAHTLPAAVLEMLSQLGNQRVDDRPLLQIFLVGRNSLKDALEMANRDLFRLHTVAFTQLHALDSAETQGYIHARVSGHNIEFSPAAVEAIFRETAGIPGVVNRLCAEIGIGLKVNDGKQVDETAVSDGIEALHAATRVVDIPPTLPEWERNAQTMSGETEALTERLSDLETAIGELKQDVREESNFIRSLLGEQMDIEDDDIGCRPDPDREI